MSIKYPAITIWQPWATLIAIGAKPFEFRSWPVPARLIGQRIAVHAGARPVRCKEVSDLLLRLQAGDPTTCLDPVLATPLLERVLAAPTILPLSSIVCLATIGSALRDAELAARLSLPQLVNDSDRDDHTNWGWPLNEIEVLEPFQPARGAQGWWNWTQNS